MRSDGHKRLHGLVLAERHLHALVKVLGGDDVLERGSNQSPHLRALHAEVAVERRLVLARLADIMVCNGDADELAHHSKPHREHDAGVRAGSVRLCGHMRDPRVVLLVLLEREVDGRERRKAVLLFVAHHGINVRHDELAVCDELRAGSATKEHGAVPRPARYTHDAVLATARCWRGRAVLARRTFPTCQKSLPWPL